MYKDILSSQVFLFLYTEFRHKIEKCPQKNVEDCSQNLWHKVENCPRIFVKFFFLLRGRRGTVLNKQILGMVEISELKKMPRHLQGGSLSQQGRMAPSNCRMLYDTKARFLSQRHGSFKRAFLHMPLGFRNQ